MTNFYEKVSSAPGNLANGAIYLINKTYLKKLKKKTMKIFQKKLLLKMLIRYVFLKLKNFIWM